jgi:hypothetical protein
MSKTHRKLWLAGRNWLISRRSLKWRGQEGSGALLWLGV